MAVPEKKRPIRVHQLDTGLGSGNTGDDATFLAAQARLEPEFELSTEVHSLKRTEVLPQGVRYLSVEDSGAIEESIREADLVLLIGDTPVMDQWGLAWPLQANAGKLRLCHELGKTVHALGVGVDRLQDPEGLRIFQEAYLPIASWSVRSENCKKALLEMGVSEEKIVVGADWAWLLGPQINSEWANKALQKAGASTGRLPIGVNLVNEIWKDEIEMKKAWGTLLDRLIEKYDAQVFFFCNESREGDYFDQAAAAEVREGMRHPSIMVPSRYYEPNEMISLLSCMKLNLSQRYHFTLFSILADVYPISIQRGQKMEGLNQELDLPFVGDMTHLDEKSIEREVEAVLNDAEAKMEPLRVRRKHLEARAMNNLSLVRY
ncbi:MAG: polysaccharide pyruvyl transferase family protein [Acidobacteria bacterium]|nr:polysaccharide pyruvyl transferase family protein [Acidobacteriota bacterium]